MKHDKIKVALIGATGKAGRYVLPRLISEGYSIRVLVRDQERFEIKHSAADKSCCLDALKGYVSDDLSPSTRIWC